MSVLKNLLESVKNFKKELLIIKILILIIINIWLLLIFWKILFLNGINVANNSIAITKMQTWFQPLLQILGLDIINPNVIKIMLISSIIVLSNLAVLYFSQMLAIILLGMTARYGYKSYNNYINKDTLNYYGFEKVQETLTLQEKSNILNDFINVNVIKDPNVIGFLQNKISNINCANKNELILNINNSWLDYKQQLLSKLVLQQKEQMDKIEIINKKGSTWSLDSIDYWTLLKIGSGIIIVAVIVIGGYSYFNNNAVKAAHDMSKKVLDANKKISDVLAESTAEQNNLINDKIKNISDVLAEGLQKDSLETKLDIIVLTQKIQDNTLLLQENQIKMKDFIVNVTTKNDAFIKQSLSIQNDIVKISKDTISENLTEIESVKNLNELTQSITLELKTTNENIMQIQNEQEKLINITSLIAKEGENPSLLSTLIDFRTDLNTCLSTGAAILTFLGLTVTLDDIGTEMVNKIREETGREIVYQRVLERQDLSEEVPVIVSEDDNIEDEQDSDDDSEALR